MNKRTTAAALLLGLVLAGCGAGGDEGLRASTEPGATESVAPADSTTTTALAGPATSTALAGQGTTTTARATSTTASTTTSGADQSAVEAARQAKDSADRAEGSAQRAEEAATAATSTTTTAAPAPTTTTTTTAPKVYGWVEVARFDVAAGPAETPPLVKPVTLAGGRLRVLDPGSLFPPKPLMAPATLWLGPEPVSACPATADNTGTVVAATSNGCALWAGPWPAVETTMTLGFYWNGRWTGAPYQGGQAKTVTVEEYREL